MKITVFAKKIKVDEKTSFVKYLTTLKRADGTEIHATVKFADITPPAPKNCPCNIEFERCYANLATGTYTDEKTGEIRDTYTLWISEYKDGEPYVDHSLDNFE